MITINVKKLITNDEIDQDFDLQVGTIEGITLIGPLSVVGKIVKTEGGITVIGKIKGREKVTCDKCLEEFDRDIDKDFSQHYVWEKKSQDDEYAEKAGFVVDDKNNINLEEALLEEIKVDEMSGNFCSKTCKGLCPGCGKNLNKNKCMCYTKKDADNPFAKLKKLKEK